MDKVERFALVRSFLSLNSGASRLEHYSVNLDGGLFNHLIEVKLGENEIETPAMFTDLAVNIHRNGFRKMVIPIFNNSFAYNVSMAGNILDKFYSNDWADKLIKVVTSKGDVYYGSNGLILDGSFNPLMVTTVTLEVVKRGNEVAYTPTKASCRIPFELFERQGELLPKTIVKKIIPLYATKTLQPYSSSVLFGKKAEIIIGMGANIIFRPSLPKPTNATEEEFKRILRENAEGIA